MKLYFSPAACSLVPHIVLREAGTPFTLEKVDTAKHRTPDGADYYTINPKGQVPLLQLDDGQLRGLELPDHRLIHRARENAVPLPVFQPLREAAAQVSRLQIERPRPMLGHITPDAAHDIASIGPRGIDEDGDGGETHGAKGRE